MKTYEICVVESSYLKDGKNKNNYRKIGSMLEHSDGRKSIKLDKFFNPLGALNEKGECWLSVFEPKNNNEQNANVNVTNNSPNNTPHLEEDIPF